MPAIALLRVPYAENRAENWITGNWQREAINFHCQRRRRRH